MSSFREIIAKQIVVDGSVSSSLGKSILAAADAAGARFVIDAAASSHASAHATGGSDALTPSDIGAAPAASPTFTGNASFSASSGVPLTVTNTGSGNSFVVEDAAGDTSPFVINADGNVVAGGNSRNIGVASRLAVSAENANWGVAIQAVCDSVGRGINIVSSDYSPNPDTGSLLYFNAASGGFTIGCSSPGNSALGFVNFSVSSLGINRTSPASALDVNGVITVSAGSVSAPALVSDVGGSDTGIWWPTGGDRVAISTAGLERLRVNHIGWVGVGTNSPSSLLDVNGVITVSAGSAASPAICASGDANTGIAFPAADTAIISTGGSERLRVDSTGRVGIGLTEPLAPLNVIAADSGAAAACQHWGYNSFNNAGYNLKLRTGVTSGVVRWCFDQTNNSTNYSNVLCIDRGKVGVGTANPATALDVNGVVTVSAGSAAAPALVASGDSNTGLLFPAADTVAISTAGVERVRVDSSGRLLVGATSGTFPLTVVANSSAQGIQIRGRSADGIADIWMTSNDGETRYGYISSRSNTFQFRPPSGAIIDFANHAGTASLLRIQDGGNVGIGATSPTAKLDIDADTVRLRTAKTPASSSDTGNTGDICWDASYLYICTAPSTWRRIAHSTW